MNRAVAVSMLCLALACWISCRSASRAASSQTARSASADSAAGARPLETRPPNVPEFQPAFAGQTRAPRATTKTALQVDTVAVGFNKPWAVAFLPDGRFLVTEKPTGHLYVVTSAGEKSAPVAGLPPVDGRNQCGLLDVEIAPDYATSGLVYWSYVEKRPNGNGLVVARAKLVEKPNLHVEGLQTIFRMEPTLESTLHNGGRIVFTPDGYLYIVLGERSIPPGRKQAQDLASDFGKVVRLRPDGTIPDDNPFVGRAGARPEIWTLGHRNILSAALDDRGRLWVVEMGPKGGDELNLVEKGKDYGWPTIGYGEEYSGQPIHESTQAPGMEQPVYYWDPVIAPSGLAIVSSPLFPEWKGNFLIGGLVSTALVRLVLENDRVVGEEHLLTERGERIRDVAQGPDGAIYLVTDEENGQLLRVTPQK